MSVWRKGVWRVGLWRNNSWRGLTTAAITRLYGRSVAAKLPNYLISRSGNMFRRAK